MSPSFSGDGTVSRLDPGNVLKRRWRTSLALPGSSLSLESDMRMFSTTGDRWFQIQSGDVSDNRRLTGLRVLVALGIVMTLSCHATSDDATSDDATQADVDAVRLLAGQLDSPEYERREAATRKLSRMGASVADAVAEVGLSGSAEAGVRAVSVLKELYFSDQTAAINAAEAALKRLTLEAKPSVAVEAQAALRSNYFSIRQPRAIEAIRVMGGQVQIERGRPALLAGQAVQPPDGGGWVDVVAVGPDWTGGDAGFRHVARLDTLRVLYMLSGHPISDEALAEFKRDLPSAEIQTRGSAFLGVRPATDSLGCAIYGLTVDGAAAQAGIEMGDVVVEIEGERVQTADDLVDLVGKYKPGDQVRIVVFRFPQFDGRYKYKLTQMLHDPESFSPLLSIGIMSQVRREIPVTLKKWQLNN